MAVRTVLCVLTVLAYAYGEVVIETDNGWARDKSSKQTNASAILPKKYVYGGANAEAGAYPWMVHLETVIDMGSYERIIQCGGSLISDRHVLTAAHCIHLDLMKQYHNLNIYLGEYDTDSNPKDCAGDKCVWNRLVYPDKIFIHAHYNSGKNDNNDIALVRLEKRIRFTPSIQPIPLLPFDVDTPEFVGRLLVVAGWGFNDKGETPRILQAAVMRLIPKSLCFTSPSVPPSSFCLEDTEVQSVCSGDSGGPAVMYYRNKYYLAGITSRGSPPCGTAGIGSFSNIFRHMKWIKSHMDLV